MRIAKSCPCYKDQRDCEFRRKDCHSSCAEYKKWAKMLEADNLLKQNNDEYLGYIASKIDKRKKEKNEKNNFRR